MTDTSKEIDLAALIVRFRADQEAYRASAAAIRPHNRTALFDALAAAGITRVVVRFDGYGDSGQIEDITAYDASGAETGLPDAPRITLLRTQHGAPEAVSEVHGIGDALESLAYGFLAETHGGWENNDGAFGDFTFDVVRRTIALDYNERYAASVNHQHEF